MSEALAQKINELDENQLHSVLQSNALGYWCLQEPRLKIEGRLFTFDEHEYLWDLYFDTSPWIVIQKAAQVGFSTYAILRSFHGCQHLYKTGVLYLFPSRDDVTDFSKTRFNMFISENERLKAVMKDTDAANVKRIGDCFLYLRGTKSRTGLKSIPVDLVVKDERDEMDQKMVDLAMHRLGHSTFKHSLDLSTPSLEDWGINKLLKISDQKQWLIKCQECGVNTCLEMEFPNCLKMRQGKYQRVCKKCGSSIRPKDGTWIPQNKGSVISGYQISQLNSMRASMDEIMDRFLSGDNMEDFYHNVIGVPFSEDDRRLEIEDILKLCGWHSIRMNDPGPCSMGVDQGKDLHVIIGKRRSETGSDIVHIGSYKSWKDLANLMIDFRVICCVVDGLPNTDEAKRFSDSFPGRVFRRMGYARAAMGGVKFDDMDYTIMSNRTEILDNSHNQIMNQGLRLPRRCQEVEVFAQHCHMAARKLEEDSSTGEKKGKWVSMGIDHYRHAFAFECIARSRVSYVTASEKMYFGAGYKPFDAVAGY